MPLKPNLKTQAAVDAADTASLAKAKADTAEITLADWLALARNAGVTSVRLGVRDDGITIALRGNADRKNVSVDSLCPKGQPFPLHAVAALEAFRRGLSCKPPREAPMSAVVEGEPDTVAASYETTPLADVPDVLESPQSRALQEIADAVASGDSTPPGAFLDKVVEGVAGRKADRAAEIAARANPINIYKPPPAGAGERRPLSLPLCKQCEAQPVYQSGAEFCGGSCAKWWFTEHARKAAKGSRR